MSEQPVAIVTAASGGIGAACARELAGRGYRVGLLARSPDVQDLARELRGVGWVGSVASVEGLEGVVRTTLEAFGRIDGVVNNTGHPAKGELLEISDADWHAGLDLLLLNVARMARLVTPIMEWQAAGRSSTSRPSGRSSRMRGFPCRRRCGPGCRPSPSCTPSATGGSGFG